MNWLDLVIIACVVAGLIKGLKDGFVKQAISFLALIAAIFFAGKAAVALRGFLQRFFSSDLPSPLLTGICYLLAFGLIITVIVLLGKLIELVLKMTPAKPLNILLGGLFGMFIWILSLSILFNIFAVFDYGSKIISKPTQEKSIFYDRTKEIVPLIYPFLKHYFTPQSSSGGVLV
jgi:membrane protein required for colicin V production